MNSQDQKGKLFSILTQNESQECIQGLASSFQENQLTLALNHSKNDLRPFMIQSVRLGIQSGISIVARNAQNNQIIGCTISYDIQMEKQFNTSNINMQVFSPLMQMMDELSKNYLFQRKALETKGEWAHLCFISVFPGFMGKGISRALLHHSLNAIKKGGYKYVYAQLTNKLSQRICLDNLGCFKPIKQLKCNELILKGQKVMPDSKLTLISAFCDLTTIQT